MNSVRGFIGEHRSVLAWIVLLYLITVPLLSLGLGKFEPRGPVVSFLTVTLLLVIVAASRWLTGRATGSSGDADE